MHKYFCCIGFFFPEKRTKEKETIELVNTGAADNCKAALERFLEHGWPLKDDSAPIGAMLVLDYDS